MVKTNTLNEQFPKGTLILGIGEGFAQIDKRIWGLLLESLTTKNEELWQK